MAQSRLPPKTWPARLLARHPRRALAALDSDQVVVFLERVSLMPLRRALRFDLGLPAALTLALTGTGGVLGLPFYYVPALGFCLLLLARALPVLVALPLAFTRAHAIQIHEIIHRLVSAQALSHPDLPRDTRTALTHELWVAELAYLLLHPEGQARLRSTDLEKRLGHQPVAAPRRRL